MKLFKWRNMKVHKTWTVFKNVCTQTRMKKARRQICASHFKNKSLFTTKTLTLVKVWNHFGLNPLRALVLKTIILQTSLLSTSTSIRLLLYLHRSKLSPPNSYSSTLLTTPSLKNANSFTCSTIFIILPPDMTNLLLGFLDSPPPSSHYLFPT